MSKKVDLNILSRGSLSFPFCSDWLKDEVTKLFDKIDYLWDEIYKSQQEADGKILVHTSLTIKFAELKRENKDLKKRLKSK